MRRELSARAGLGGPECMDQRSLFLRGAQEVLGPDHPSLTSRRASFLFAAGTKLMLVEAKNHYALWTLERLLLQNDQSVSETCRALCVFREFGEVGIRDDSVEDIEYIDFMTDIVDPGWLLRDAVTLACFSKSITPEEREHALARKETEA